MRKASKVSEQLREAIERSELSRYEICKRLDFSESVMSRFMSNRCGLAIETIDRLAELLDLELAPRKRSRGRR